MTPLPLRKAVLLASVTVAIVTVDDYSAMLFSHDLLCVTEKLAISVTDHLTASNQCDRPFDTENGVIAFCS